MSTTPPLCGRVLAEAKLGEVAVAAVLVELDGALQRLLEYECVAAEPARRWATGWGASLPDGGA